MVKKVDPLKKAQGERLAALRLAAGFEKARQASAQFDWAESTYSAHEGGRRTIGQDDAERYVAKFGLGTAAWILFGRPEDAPKSLVVSPKVERPPSDVSAPMPIPEVSKRKIPVYGVAVGGNDGRMKFNGDRLDLAGCPPELENVFGAYAVDVAGDSMVPVYKPGMRVWINPNLSARVGDEVIVQLRPEDESDAPDGYIKEFVKRTASKLVLKQYNPVSEIEYDLREVVSVHVVVFASRR